MKEKEEKTMKAFPGGNLGNWMLVAHLLQKDMKGKKEKIKITPLQRKRLKLGLAERTKVRKRQEQKRREKYFKGENNEQERKM